MIFHAFCTLYALMRLPLHLCFATALRLAALEGQLSDAVSMAADGGGWADVALQQLLSSSLALAAAAVVDPTERFFTLSVSSITCALTFGTMPLHYTNNYLYCCMCMVFLTFLLFVVLRNLVWVSP